MLLAAYLCYICCRSSRKKINIETNDDGKHNKNLCYGLSVYEKINT